MALPSRVESSAVCVVCRSERAAYRIARAFRNGVDTMALRELGSIVHFKKYRTVVIAVDSASLDAEESEWLRILLEVCVHTKGEVIWTDAL